MSYNDGIIYFTRNEIQTSPSSVLPPLDVYNLQVEEKGKH